MCTAGKVRRGSSSPCCVPDPSEVFQTRRGGAMDPHTRLPGYTCSTMLGVTQVWFAAHHVGHVLKTLRSGQLDELHRRMKRNPHVLDARVCRAVLWWSILGEAMDAAKQAEQRRAKRRESRRLVVMLAVSQRRGNVDSSTAQSKPRSQEVGPAEAPPRSGMTRRSSRTWTLPPLTAGDQSQGGGGRAPCHGGPVDVSTRGYRAVHLDEAAILSKIYDFL